MAFDALGFRKALGCFATGVTVITAVDDDGNPHGLTANSFTSVSLDPPLVLFCIDKRSNCLSVLENAKAFGVNMLSADQEGLSNQFAFSEDRWGGVETLTLDTGTPLLKGCLANLDCSMHAQYDAGDHIIVVGKVENLQVSDDGKPLLYYRGKYRAMC